MFPREDVFSAVLHAGFATFNVIQMQILSTLAHTRETFRKRKRDEHAEKRSAFDSAKCYLGNISRDCWTFNSFNTDHQETNNQLTLGPHFVVSGQFHKCVQKTLSQTSKITDRLKVHLWKRQPLTFRMTCFQISWQLVESVRHLYHGICFVKN